MTQALFQLANSAAPRSRIALEPVYNTLNSMALLNAADTLPALDSWVRASAAAMTPVERHTNRLIFEGMGAALVANAAGGDFEAYLDALTVQHPEALRDHVLTLLGNGKAADSDAAPIMPEQLLADRGAYIAQVQRAAAGAPIDQALHGEVHTLLNDPFRMHDLLVTHLRALWETALAAEWARVQRSLENQVKLLQRSAPGSGLAPEVIMERLQTFIAHPAGADNADQVVFVPSAHTGRYTTELRHGGTRWLFFDVVPNYPVLLRDSPVGDAELIGRLSALTEPMRLRVLELLAQHDELSIQELMEALNQSQPNISRYLKSLGIYVAERRGKDGKKHYRLAPTQLDLTFQALKQKVLSASPRAAAPPAEPATRQEGVARWLNAQGIVTVWPGRPRDRLAMLEYVASRFELEKIYTEPQVNELIIQTVFSYARDHVTIRRDLVDYQFLRRANDGSRYWRNTEHAGQPPQLSSEPGSQPWGPERSSAESCD